MVRIYSPKPSNIFEYLWYWNFNYDIFQWYFLVHISSLLHVITINCLQYITKINNFICLLNHLHLNIFIFHTSLLSIMYFLTTVFSRRLVSEGPDRTGRSDCRALSVDRVEHERLLRAHRVECARFGRDAHPRGPSADRESWHAGNDRIRQDARTPIPHCHRTRRRRDTRKGYLYCTYVLLVYEYVLLVLCFICRPEQLYSSNKYIEAIQYWIWTSTRTIHFF